MPLTITTGPSPAAVAEIEYRLSMMNGGGDGISRGDGDEGLVEMQRPVSMKVDVGTFRGYITKSMVRHVAVTASSTITAPTGGSVGDIRRIDIVQYTLGTGVNVVAGTESASPAAPSKSANSILLANISLRKGMVSIKDTSDGTNGFIDTTVREFV